MLEEKIEPVEVKIVHNNTFIPCQKPNFGKENRCTHHHDKNLNKSCKDDQERHMPKMPCKKNPEGSIATHTTG